jgi:putative intracellular protease/amidase
MCGGAILLAEKGLLKGRKATTPRYRLFKIGAAHAIPDQSPPYE